MRVFIPASLVAIALFAASAHPIAAEDSATHDPGSSTKAEATTESDLVTITFLQKGHKQTVKGRVVVEAADGGIMFQGVDGVLWMIEHNEIEGRERLDTPFKPLTQSELSEQILAELPAGFRTHTTTHYVVCYNTSRAYAEWVNSLLERLYTAFTHYWQNHGFESRARVSVSSRRVRRPAVVRPGEPRRFAGRHGQHRGLLQPSLESDQHV